MLLHVDASEPRGYSSVSPDGRLHMPQINELVLTMLRNELPEVADPVHELNRWWASEGTPSEDISDFLIRQGVLHPESRRTLRMAEKGFIEVTSDMLLLADIRETLTAKFRQLREPDGPTVHAADAAQETDRSTPLPAAPTVEPNTEEDFDETDFADKVDLHLKPEDARCQLAPASNPGRKDTLRSGTKLGKCMLLGVIGQGGNGTVYRAFHQSLRISVAVKVVRIREGDDEAAFRQRILEEGRMLAQLNHPNIVRVWDVEEDPVQPWLVLELIEGVTLKDLIDQSGRISPLQAVKIVREMTSALSAAWDIGIVHRDVKPANILIPKTGPTRLADLGLARVVTPNLGNSRQANAGGMAGTVAYMSPEQAETADTADHRSDMYSLGATFYHMLTGEIPFAGQTLMEVICKHAAAQIVPPHEKVAGLSPSFHRSISKMMAKKPQDRHQTFAELTADLNKLEAELTHGQDENHSTGAVNRGLMRRLFGR